MKATLAEALSRTLLLCRDNDIVGGNHPSDEQLISALRDTRVVLVSDANNLASSAGQTAIVALLNVVARFGVSTSISMPEVPLLSFQPPLRGAFLRSALLELGRDLLPDTQIDLCEPDAPGDVAIVLGDSNYRGRADIALRLSGDAWSGWSAPASESASRFDGDFPIGALVAAGIAAPEPFKAALRKLGRRLPLPVGDMYLEPVEHATIRVAPQATPTTPFDLGRVDCISGGAIINAALFTLLRRRVFGGRAGAGT